MYYVVETEKSFDQARADLETAAKANGFGVLYVHDLANTFHSKSISFDNRCREFEIRNPEQASKVLSIDMRLNMALSQDLKLNQIAQEVEVKTIQMVDEAK